MGLRESLVQWAVFDFVSYFAALSSRLYGVY
jgi:hypothetical protein